MKSGLPGRPAACGGLLRLAAAACLAGLGGQRAAMTGYGYGYPRPDAL
ncbi:MAG TPA: hypothetical protein VG734_10595 [Lacunisphaera sp.]|nr:hypothetical protein [Lacunisphaera sp.]